MADARVMPSTPALETPSLVDQLVDATPAGRDRYVDFLRALSIAVVVCWHWVFSVTQWRAGRLTMPNPIGEVPLLWSATWLLQIMPLFFFVGFMPVYPAVFLSLSRSFVAAAF